MTSEEKKAENSDKSSKEKENENESEDIGLAQFKEEALQKCILEKALNRPEANCCTYNKGYITQECFSCMTCFQETKKRAVICLGCSIKCHEDNHDIAPIGFKRHIRCDCGNNNFLMECKLKKKDEIDYENQENVYNHNMENKYCYCDEEDDGNSTMAQCFFCEDWFHKEHLNVFGINLEEKNDEDIPALDLVCKNCVKKLKDILKGYNLKKVVYGLMPKENFKVIEIKDDNDKDKDNNKEENKSLLGKKRKLSADIKEIKNDKKEKEEKEKDNNINDNNNTNNNNNNILDENNKICKFKIDPENEVFLTQVIQNEQNLFIDCEIFLKMLCKCPECSKLYDDIGMSFMKNENTFKEWTERKTFDDIISDEKFIEEAKNGNQISIDNLENSVRDFLCSKEYRLLTVEQQTVIRGYIGELWNKLGEFVSTLNHQIITVEDIYNFIQKYKDYFESLKHK